MNKRFDNFLDYASQIELLPAYYLCNVGYTFIKL